MRRRGRKHKQQAAKRRKAQEEDGRQTCASQQQAGSKVGHAAPPVMQCSRNDFVHTVRFLLAYDRLSYTMSSQNDDWILRFQGAEARVFFGTYGGKRAVKKERFEKKYRHPDLDQQLRKQRTRAEVKSLSRVRDKCPRIAHLIPHVLFSDTSTIIMEEVVDGRMCVDVIREETAAGRDTDKLFQAMGSMIGELHGAGIVHGDLTTCNLLVKGEEVLAIDFGLSSSSCSDEDRAVDLYVLERALQSSGVSDDRFSVLLSAYTDILGQNSSEKVVQSVIKRLELVRSRGRKRCMAG